MVKNVSVESVEFAHSPCQLESKGLLHKKERIMTKYRPVTYSSQAVWVLHFIKRKKTFFVIGESEKFKNLLRPIFRRPSPCMSTKLKSISCLSSSKKGKCKNVWHQSILQRKNLSVCLVTDCLTEPDVVTNCKTFFKITSRVFVWGNYIKYWPGSCEYDLLPPPHGLALLTLYGHDHSALLQLHRLGSATGEWWAHRKEKVRRSPCLFWFWLKIVEWTWPVCTVKAVINHKYLYYFMS